MLLLKTQSDMELGAQKILVVMRHLLDNDKLISDRSPVYAANLLEQGHFTVTNALYIFQA